MTTTRTFWFRRLKGNMDWWIAMHGTEAQARAGRGLKTFCSRTFVMKTGIEVPRGEIVEVEMTFDVKNRTKVRG